MSRLVTMSIPHTLGKAEARRRIEQGFGKMTDQMAGGVWSMVSFEHRWEGDRLHFEASTMGQSITGRLDILAESVQIEIDAPPLLARIAERITAGLKRETQKLLEKK